MIGERDFESHLIAIRDLLRRNKEADAATAKKIEKLAKKLRASGGGDPEEGRYLGDHYADQVRIPRNVATQSSSKWPAGMPHLE